MFEPPTVDDLDLRGCADALDAAVVEQRRVGARRMALVAHWADLHCPPPATTPCTGVRRHPGGSDGTPEVTEFTTTELGMLLGTSTLTASCLLRDVLDVRHRLPLIWAAVMTGQVEDWKARKVARATQVLTVEQARWVDAQVLEALIGLPFGRALSVVEGKVVAADPAGFEARRRTEAERRFVSVSRPTNPHGLRTLVAQSSAGDIARVYAMVDRLANLLGRAGDPDTAEVRRAKALGVLGNPALACVLLSQHHPDAERQAPEPDELAEPPSPVELGTEVGRALTALGTKDLDRLRPRTVLYLHLAEQAVDAHQRDSGSQVVRTEGLGALSVDQLREWLGADQVVVKPVIDVAGQRSVDAYEIPTPLAEALTLQQPFEVFPFGTLPSRKADKDHTQRYVRRDDGGPPGQTSTTNLGPLGRGHHRAKTFGGFSLHQPLPGLYLWETPSGHWYRVDHQGTTPLGTRTPDIILHRRRRGSPMERGLIVDIATRCTA